MLGAVLPTWAKVGASTLTPAAGARRFPRRPIAHREMEGAIFLRPRRGEGLSQLSWFGWVSQRGGSAVDSRFHLVDAGFELSIQSLLIYSLLQGISRSLELEGTRPRVWLSIPWVVVNSYLLGVWG